MQIENITYILDPRIFSINPTSLNISICPGITPILASLMTHNHFLQERDVHARKGNRARFKWNAREKIVWGRASERKKENGGRRDRADPIDVRDDGQEANLGR